ncbi:Holliday junction resolvase RuvX [Paenirhodobacter enshiensis]|uniref:Holliday junction resolvase RuvX n=1 Tax=Paenirhodobacter enshiensis TaxID=1105367 RepID=UPI003FA2DD8F
MIVTDIAEFATALPRHGALVGLDLGTKTIGVAVSDIRRTVATPMHTVRREKFTLDAAEVLRMAGERETVGFVLGLPINMDGTEGPRCQSSRAFARNFEKLTALPITFWDERLSTVAAHRAMLEADLSRKRRAELVDSVAAGFILQGVLDRLENLGRAE